MTSRALMVRCINHFVNNNKQCSKNLSTFSVLCNKNAKDSDNSLDKKDCTSSAKPSGVPKEIYKKERESLGYITTESEPNVVELANGIVMKYDKVRHVRISQPTKNAMQSGTHNLDHWQLTFDMQERWENPLMGWCSSADPYQALVLNFSTKEAAIQHCISMGWKYSVQKPNKVGPKPRTYAENFSWDKRTRVSTK